MIDWLNDTRWLGLSMTAWLIALAVATVCYTVVRIAIEFVTKRLALFASKTPGHYDDIFVAVLQRTNRFCIFLGSVLVGLGTLDLNEKWTSHVQHAWFIVVGLQIALWLNRAVMLGVKNYLQQGDKTIIRETATGAIMSFMLRFLVWAVLVLGILANLGVNITTFIASLGIGGIAVALAVQNVLGDLFASLAIALDKPFEVGDFIVVDSSNITGTVQHVGLKTTRIKALSGELIVRSNTELLQSTIHNFRPMTERRIVFGFGLTYDTPVETLKQVPNIVRAIVTGIDNARFDRAHFKGLGESSLDFEVVYIVLSGDYAIYMDIQQRINFELMDAIAELKSDFAFPSRTVYMVSDAKPSNDENDSAERPKDREQSIISAAH